MVRRVGLLLGVALLAVACGGTPRGANDSAPPSPSATAIGPANTSTTPQTGTPTATPSATTSPRPSTSPTPRTDRVDLRASRLAIPSLGIDAPVGPSYEIPDTAPPTPGCPPRPPGGTTFTVPSQGIVTPVERFEGLENKAWIFGHSRWQGQPGLFFSLQDIDVGDTLVVGGLDRTSGESVPARTFVVDGLFLTDLDAGAKLVTAASPTEIPPAPIVILQTSVREDGADRPWILDRQKVMAKSQNLVEGDLNDPCKYLLLFVFASPA